MNSTRLRYRHLFFDLDNTIWDFDRNSWFALRETFRKFNLDEGRFEEFFASYNHHNERLWELYRKNAITKQALSHSRFDLALQEMGITGIDGMEFNDAYLEGLPLQTRLCEGAPKVLEILSAKYQMHIITNGFVEVQYKKMALSRLSPFFRGIFVSEEIKSPKPSPEIFRHALKSSNARKKESLMIGDSWEVDIMGAMKVGIDQVHYAPFLENRDFTPEESEIVGHSRTCTYRINRLEELLDFL